MEVPQSENLSFKLDSEKQRDLDKCLYLRVSELLGKMSMWRRNSKETKKLMKESMNSWINGWINESTMDRKGVKWMHSFLRSHICSNCLLNTHSLTLYCSLWSPFPQRSFVCSLVYCKAHWKVIYVCELNAFILCSFIQFQAIEK